MHRHQKVWPLVRSTTNQLRCASTAVKEKVLPSLAETPVSPTRNANPNLSNPSSHPQPLHFKRSQVRTAEAVNNKWKRPPDFMNQDAGRDKANLRTRNHPHPNNKTTPFRYPEPSRPAYSPVYINSPPNTQNRSSRVRLGSCHGQQVTELQSRPSRGIPQDRNTPSTLRNNQAKAKAQPRGHSISQRKTPPVDVYIPTTVTVGNLSRLLGVKLETLQHKMRHVGMAEEATYDHVLTSDYASLLAEEFNRRAIINDENSFDLHPPPPHPNPSSLPFRPPIVTIMGHVDHGKTTLLDTLRSSSVAKGEAGGITQHIGAFSVPVTSASAPDGIKSITFLDTPGHAAFSAIRARGARVTDIIVLVVAADDGIMPQTKEVIELIKKEEGNVAVVIAINKVDKPEADVEAVQKALMAEGLQLEVYGGDIPSVEVSGLTGQGLPELIETISAVAEIQDLRASKEGNAYGYVLESRVHKGLGPVATVLVLQGCLKPGSHLIGGLSNAKVRVMKDSSDSVVKAAYPGMAVTVSGWKTLPNAGDEVIQGNEADIKKALANRERKRDIEASIVDAEAINNARRHERELRSIQATMKTTKKPEHDQEKKGPKELRLIVKADVTGSSEAVLGALQGIGNKEAAVKVVSCGVGDVSESDVMLAKAVGGMIVGFSVSVPRPIEILAAQNNIPIYSSNIIYRIMDEIKERVIALLPVIIETKVTGEATVLQLFDIHLKAKQIKKVAGCRVTNGLVEKSKFARVVRDGVIVHEGTLDTMRLLKKDVTEVRKGSECGLSLDGFEGLHEGDIIQMYQRIEKPGVL
ncbi:hypothetical protein AX16_003681 [Volvariella volvacea WC 439]|nr:hypothetical protein AX16_003681 [Volvariella volvacea WC 439]